MDMMLLRVLGMTEMRGVVISQKNTRLTTKKGMVLMLARM